jgi:hypothetical protein
MPIIAGRASAAYGSGFGKAPSGSAYAGPFGAYDALATTTLSSTTNSVIFAGIPSEYQHLQLRAINLSSGQDNYLAIRFNGDAKTHYTVNQFDANGTTLTFSGTIDYTIAGAGYTADATYPAITIYDIFDYSNPNKMKTTRATGGTSRNGSLAYMGLIGSAWRQSNPIQQIEIFHGNIAGGKVFNANTHFALYGVR